jgi:D-alanyl-D-alanine carboxypeptidase-like protein
VVRLALVASLLLLPATGEAAVPEFSATVSPVTKAQLRYSYRPGCPLGPSSLRSIRLSHWGFDGKPRSGVLVVHASVAADVVAVFRKLYAARFPIRRMVGVEVYRGSDDASMAADNTSGFNCRRVGDSGSWSEHAYGKAIDVNPVENPYVHRGRVEPPAGKAYLDRSRRRRGMATRTGVLVRAFDEAGWHWGGRWQSSKDYQHFSTTGR